MWAMLEDRLHTRLTSDPKLKAKLPQLERAVADGSAVAGARRRRHRRDARPMTTILITGFGRFPGSPVNPSGLIATRLVQRRRPALAQARRIAHVFATRYDAVDRELPQFLARERPDIVVMFGVATRAKMLRVEELARNRISSFPDAGGRRPKSRVIAPASQSLAQSPAARAVARGGALDRAQRDALAQCRDAISATTPIGVGLKLPRTSRGPSVVIFIHVPPIRLKAQRKHAPAGKNRVKMAGARVGPRLPCAATRRPRARWRSDCRCDARVAATRRARRASGVTSFLLRQTHAQCRPQDRSHDPDRVCAARRGESDAVVVRTAAALARCPMVERRHPAGGRGRSRTARRVFAARTAGWRSIFAVHTWIVVKPAGAEAYTRYEVTGFGAEPIRVNRLAADAYWLGYRPEMVADIRGPLAAAAIPKIEAAIRNYPYAEYGSYRMWPGPNSNTFVATVLRAAPELAIAMPPEAIGKDFRADGSLFGLTESETGIEMSLYGLLGLKVGKVEGLELNLLTLVAGIDAINPALKLPAIGPSTMAHRDHPRSRSRERNGDALRCCGPRY